jgi:hypothetical protein
MQRAPWVTESTSLLPLLDDEKQPPEPDEQPQEKRSGRDRYWRSQAETLSGLELVPKVV